MVLKAEFLSPNTSMGVMALLHQRVRGSSIVNRKDTVVCAAAPESNNATMMGISLRTLQMYQHLPGRK